MDSSYLGVFFLLSLSLCEDQGGSTLDLLSRLHHRGIPSSPPSASFPLFSILSKTSYTTSTTNAPIPSRSPEHPAHIPPSNTPLEPPFPLNTTTARSEEETSRGGIIFLGLNRTELAVSAGALLLLFLSSFLVLLAYFLCKSHFSRRNIYTTMDEQDFPSGSSHFTHPGPPVILEHEHLSMPKRKGL
eukprot:TRINITY_DN18692_c0_g1_i1.p1 TRINITY_DN18692_c0_g1~~TRINITY_DN18692_c0_g1_i1.p1  ORF type:complete len:187 (+),score=43.67 TRINITY_DN18692_c0_g1_i1:160-720(+)